MSKRVIYEAVWTPLFGGLSAVKVVEGLEEVDEIEPEYTSTHPDDSPFKYSLLEDERHFRILSLLPGDRDDDICCHLETYSLMESPEYEALSYCWGDAKEVTSITIDESAINITKNLRSALRHLRNKTATRLLWIDALCIDQHNLDEQMQQVGIMRKIYQNAVRTVIWLGLASQNSGLAFSACSAIAEQTLLSNETITKEMQQLSQNKDSISSPTIKGEILTEIQISAIESLVARPWFKRIWVVQELVLAREAILVCGWKEISWDTFSIGVKTGLTSGQLDEPFLGIVPGIECTNFNALVSVHSRDIGCSSTDQLLDLLVRFRTREATDPRDKVYSLLGLIENIEDIDLVPDYRPSCTAAEVFTKTATVLLRGSGNLDIFGQCPAAPNIELGALPTWVADWSFQKGTARPFITDAAGKIRTTSATGKSKAAPRFLEQSTILELSGHTVDFIAETADVLEDMSDPDAWVANESDYVFSEEEDGSILGALKDLKNAFGLLLYVINELFRVVSHLEIILRWEKFANVDQKNDTVSTPTGEDNATVYWQTLCTGCMPEGFAATEKQYQDWYTSLSNVRRLVCLRVNKLPKLFRPFAFALYVRATWETYGKFGALMGHASFRRLARTKRGHLCLVPEASRVNDPIVLCVGGKVPLIARVEDGYWRLIGESYVHGLMNGEAFDHDACEQMLFK